MYVVGAFAVLFALVNELDLPHCNNPWLNVVHDRISTPSVVLGNIQEVNLYKILSTLFTSHIFPTTAHTNNKQQQCS